MNGKIPMIADGGECSCGVESTVICFDNDRIRVLRPGAVTPEMLREYAEVIVDNGVLKQLSPDEKVMSPGMKYKHYSPSAEVFVLNGNNEQILDFIKNKDIESGTIAVLCNGIDFPEEIRVLPYGRTSEEQAENLFSRQDVDAGWKKDAARPSLRKYFVFPQCSFDSHEIKKGDTVQQVDCVSSFISTFVLLFQI